VDVMPSMMDAELAIQQRRPSAVVVDPFIQVGTKHSSTGENSPWQALQNIRRLIPYSFILATCNHDDYEAALLNGANAFLPKPYKLLPLLSWLDYVLKVKSI
jgi:CheY-like chemotaxis protein